MAGGSSIAAANLADSLLFSSVPDDILVNILCRLDEDPRDLARLACVSMRFCTLIKTVCWKFKCEKTLPLLVAELLQSPSPALQPCPEPPGGWASLQKLLVCCPGLWHAGVLLESWDFGLDREIGWSDDFGYPDGPSYSDHSIAPESIIPELRYSPAFESIGKKSCDRIPNLVACTPASFAAECSLNGLAASGMGFPNAKDVETHVSCDVGGSDSVNSRRHFSEAEAGTNFNGNAGGMACENEADMDSSTGKEMGVHEVECEKKQFLTHMNHNAIGLDGDAHGVSMRCVDDAGEGLNFVKIEVGSLDKCWCNKTYNKLGPKHCNQLGKSESKAMNRVLEVCLMTEHEVQGSADENDGALTKKGALENYKSSSMQSSPKLLSRDPSPNNVPLNFMSCRHQSQENSDSAEIHTNFTHLARSGASSHGKRVQKRKPGSNKRRRRCQNSLCHVATRPWNLSREQGNKLLANRFRADSLYICDWPGCSHPGDKRMYKLFRGVFKNFKHSHVWRNLKDMQAKATNVGCAFCVCKSTWDMVTTFCLKRSIEYHDDGEPVVRAYVCENGHVAGAWTDRPMYTL